MEPTAQAPEFSHRLLNGEGEYTSAIDAVIQAAQRSLRIFDPDLAKGGYSSLRRFESLRDFLLRGRSNRLEIVLHETDYLTGHCPRLMQLLQTHGHNICIHKTQEHARLASDPFIVADAAHYVHRFHHEGIRSLLAMHDHAGARALEERFSQLYEASHPAVFATTLGL